MLARDDPRRGGGRRYGDRRTAVREAGAAGPGRVRPHRAAACGAGLRDRTAGAGRTIARGRD